MARIILVLVFIAFASIANAFEFPLQHYSISYFVDHDPRAGVARDYAGGSRTYDYRAGTQHTGTDFKAQLGAAVTAAADGVVVGVRTGQRDGEFTALVARIGASAAIRAFQSARNAAGNFVAVRHADGRVAIYAHLGEGSIAVSKGQRVWAGQTLGRVGLTGMTNWPHLHFELRDARGDVLDPFALGLWRI